MKFEFGDNYIEYDAINGRELLNENNINHIIKDAIKVGMFVRQDGLEINTDKITQNDKYKLIVMFIQYLIETDEVLTSRFIFAEA